MLRSKPFYQNDSEPSSLGTVSAYCIDTGRPARAAQGIPGNDLTREFPLIFFFYFFLSLHNFA